MLFEFDMLQWLVVIAMAILIGFSKTAIMGAGVLIMPLLVLVLPARQANGFILPMFIFADIFAIIYWRRHVNWKQLFRLLPWTIVGIVAGYFCLDKITDAQLLPVLGVIICGLLTLNYVMETQSRLQQAVPHTIYFASFMGILTGLVSMLAHFGGPLMTVYLLALRFDKHKFVGTGAWFFWMVNLIKMPFGGKLGIINSTSLLTNLVLAPRVVLGAYLGIVVIHRISQKRFVQIVYLLALGIAVYLVLTPWLNGS